MAVEWTPKMQRTRDKWRKPLQKIQYDEEISAAELNDKMKELKAQNIEKNAPIIVYKAPAGGNVVTNTALYVLSYLIPETKGKQNTARKKK